MRYGRLSKREKRTLLNASEIADRLSEYKDSKGELDDEYQYARDVSNSIIWLPGEVNEREARHSSDG